MFRWVGGKKAWFGETEWWRTPMSCALAGIASASSPISAQNAGPPPEIRQCRGCTIERRLIAVLDTVAVDGSYLPSGIHRLPGDRLLVTSWPGRDARPPQIFSSNGKLIRTVGRVGGGPMEFRAAPLLVPARADSFLIFDPVIGRISVTDSGFTLGRIVTDATVSRIWQALPLPDGHILASGLVATPGSVGFPLHEFNEQLELVASFGRRSTTFLPNDDRTLHLVLAPARDGGFWAAGGRVYSIQKWSAQHRLERGVEPEVGWFPQDTLEVRRSNPEPRPHVIGIYEDALGFVWVCTTIADENWRAGLGSPVRAGTETRYPIVDANRYLDTMVQVFDGRNFRSIVAERFDEAFVGLFEAGLTGAMIELPAGTPQFVVWGLGLRQPIRR